MWAKGMGPICLPHKLQGSKGTDNVSPLSNLLRFMVEILYLLFFPAAEWLTILTTFILFYPRTCLKEHWGCSSSPDHCPCSGPHASHSMPMVCRKCGWGVAGINRWPRASIGISEWRPVESSQILALKGNYGQGGEDLKSMSFIQFGPRHLPSRNATVRGNKGDCVPPQHL